MVNLPWQQINRSIETAIRANIRTKYPGNETEAALRLYSLVGEAPPTG